MAGGTVAVKFVGDVAALKRSIGEAESSLGEFGKAAGGLLKAGMFAAGAAGAAALGAGFNQALQNERAVDKAAASLGLSAAEAEKLGKIAGDVYAGAWGDSMDQVAGVVAQLQGTIGKLDDDADIEGLTQNALDFAAAFEQDVTESVNAAQLLLANDLVSSGEEAFDLLTAASQNLPAGVRDELLAATNEYSTFFADLGITGSEAFGLIVDAAEEGGTYGVDKLGDAIKEFGIRATDGSKASKAAFATIGEDATKMTADLLAGGDTARAAFDRIVNGLADVEDPAARAQASIALFGTPLEDLSVSEIPTFLASLQNMQGGLGDVSGAADAMGDTLNDNLGTKIEAFKRQGLMALADLVETRLLPAIETIAPIVQQTFGAVAEAVGVAVETVRGWFVQNEASIDQLGSKFQEFYVFVGKIMEAWQTVIAVAVAVVTDLWARFGEDIIEYARTTWDSVMAIASAAFEVLGGLLDIFIGVFTGDWSRMWDGVKSVLGGTWDAMVALVSQALGTIEFVIAVTLGAISSAWSVAWNAMSTFLSDIWDGIKAAVSAAVDFVLEQVGRITGAIDNAIGRIGNLVSKIGSIPGAGVVGDVLGGIPGFANGIRSFGGGLAVVGERGPELVSLPRGASVYSNAESQGMGGLNGMTVHVHNDLDWEVLMQRAAMSGAFG